ncbi:MAG: hypothetical protein H8E42_04670 [Nitrospinae bacterium]|nr:hypothetical protein [Nitrospinota bacterium]MBL7021599.1 hypothetical protein [Nitrospinaceae bacterium]
MQCPDCGYISFKQEKDCGSCGFSFKKSATSSASLFRNDSFTIFASSKAPENKQESSGASTSQAEEGIAVIETRESSQENPELKSEEFLLNLSDAEQDQAKTTSKPDSSELDTTDFTAMEFGSGTDINLEEMEVEGLGLGLEPFEEEPPTPATTKTEPEEVQVDVSEELETIDLSPENIELKINGLESSLPTEDPAFEKVDEEIEITLSPSHNLEDDTAEPVPPVLDLGGTEILLDADEGLVPETPELSPPPVQLDELEIKLEIDESDGPLVISDEDISEVEIEDLGLELEDSDSPPDPEKP